MTMETILLIDPDAESSRGMVQFLANVDDMPVEQSPSCADFAGQWNDVTVVVLGSGCDEAVALREAEQATRLAPTASVLLVTPAVSTELLRLAMRVGIDDVVSTDDPASEFSSAVTRARDRARAIGKPVEGVQEQTVKERPAAVATVFSTKGGVGKTVIATNLGVALASMGRKVVLVDLDLQFGDVGIMLGLEPTHTISEAAQAAERLDIELLRGLLVPHDSGLMCLLAPTQPEEAEGITPGRIARIIELLAGEFDLVIIDTGASFDESVLTALDRSRHVLAVTMMDVASIKNTRISLQKLKQLGYNGASVELILNRADSKVFLAPAEVERAIGAPISNRIPSDRIVPQSVNRGVPVVLGAPRSQVARALSTIARELSVEQEGVAGNVA